MSDKSTEDETPNPEYERGFDEGYRIANLRVTALRLAIDATQHMANPTSERTCRWADKFVKFLEGNYTPARTPDE